MDQTFRHWSERNTRKRCDQRVGGGLKPVAADYKQHYCADTLRAAAAAAMVAGDGDRGGGGGDGGGGEGGGGRLRVRICVGIGVGIHIGIGIHCIVDVSLVCSSHWPAAAGERQQLLHL